MADIESQFNYTIKNIQIVDGIITKNKFGANRDVLFMNFDYFNKLMTYTTIDKCILDLDLDFKSLVTCYYLIVGSKTKDLALCYNLIVGNKMDSNYFDKTIIGILEVFDVLLCKNTFVDKFLLEIVKRLEAETPSLIHLFFFELKLSNKISELLKLRLYYRLAYLFDPTIYTTLSNCEEVVDQKIILIVLPKKLWKIRRRFFYSHCSVEGECINWGLSYLIQQNSVVASTKINLNTCDIILDSIVTFRVSYPVSNGDIDSSMYVILDDDNYSCFGKSLDQKKFKLTKFSVTSEPKYSECDADIVVSPYNNVTHVIKISCNNFSLDDVNVLTLIKHD